VPPNYANAHLRPFMSDICFLNATEMASLLRDKKLSAREIMEASLKQIDLVNPKVNAVVTLVAEQALENARKADDAQAKGLPLRPLHGLPVAHKDLLDTAGIRTTYGSRIFRDHVPSQDAIIVERAKTAGAITIGKTNTPEFGAGSQTFNGVFGATRNPYDLTKTCGGSSGGAAVALACGMTPLADGTDNGGSLRNPAAYSGIVGFRPSPGRVPMHADGNPWSTLSVHGPMARTVPDVALFLSAIAGSDARCPISIAEPGSQFASDLERDFKGVRVAWFRDLSGVPFDKRVRTAVDAQRTVFENLGCLVEEAEPDLSEANQAYHTLRAYGFLSAHAENIRKHRDLIKDTILFEYHRGLKLTASDLAQATAQRAAVWDRMRVFQKKYEYFIVPTTQVPPFDLSQEYVTEIEGDKMETYIDWMRCCYLITVTEAPSLSVPCGYTPEGLPVGLQIVGRHRGDWSVLQMGHAFEQATMTNRRRPAVAAR